MGAAREFLPGGGGRAGSLLTKHGTGYLLYGVIVWLICARSATGTEMMCCSWDGTVAYFEFAVDEIGNPMTLEEKVC